MAPLPAACRQQRIEHIPLTSPTAPPTRAGVPMVPISWQEMQCPQTKAVENRKVAKVEQ